MGLKGASFLSPDPELPPGVSDSQLMFARPSKSVKRKSRYIKHGAGVGGLPGQSVHVALFFQPF